MKRARTEKEQELLNELAEKVKYACETEQVTMAIVAAITGMNTRTYTGLMTGTRDVTTSSLMRVLDTLGYELVLVKRKNAKRLVDNPDYIARYNAYKLKNLNGTRKHRGQEPRTGNEPPKVRVKKRGITDEQLRKIASRREELNAYKSSQGDIFSIT